MSKHSKPSRPGHTNDANRIRIIGGVWRSRVIDFPASESLRPTPNRVRETLFNWLGQTLHGRRCLDLFSGSGALGFEAASRGAEKVVMVEKEGQVQKALRKNRETLAATNCHLFAGNADAFLDQNREKFDVIFLDPPFASDSLAPVLKRIHQHLSPDGVVYVEWGDPFSAIAGECDWQTIKQGKAGVVHFGLLSTKGAT
ncbi:MAG: 16S rRNA (guanine(966)-N(2))-methyltransferase RsmD [Betaproteobacteria bacterium]|nr:16S rRNA (guanine(966)-N(2))-methyltransferase RsmD [Betaproteobacteria bacterium]